MAKLIRYLTRVNLSMINVTRQSQFNSKRALFSQSSLAMPEYKNARNLVYEKYGAVVGEFKEKMYKNLTDDKSLIFTEDLKTVLHLAEKNTKDIHLIKNLLIKFINQNTEIRFGSFVFGPVVMRTFHYLNEPKTALELFMEPNFLNFFNQWTSFMILLDLLYENKMFKEVRDTYEYIKEKMLSNSIDSKLTLPVLAMACYQENTAESLQHALTICENLSNKGHTPVRKVTAIFGALAVKQNKPNIALELTSMSRAIEYVSIRCVRVMALADLDRLDDVALEFRSALKRETPAFYSYFSDTIAKVKDSLKRLNISEDDEIFELLKILEARGFIVKTTLDEHFSLDIESNKKGRIQWQENNKNYENQGWSEPRQQRNQFNIRDDWGNKQYTSA